MINMYDHALFKKRQMLFNPQKYKYNHVRKYTLITSKFHTILIIIPYFHKPEISVHFRNVKNHLEHKVLFTAPDFFKRFPIIV